MRAHGYDVIAATHDRAALERLLVRLGYEPIADQRGVTWWHPGGRTAVFLGGVVAGGGAPTGTAELIRSMVDAGAATIVLGPAEFAAIAAAHRRRDRVLVAAGAPGVGDSAAWERSTRDHRRDELAAWLRTVPLWLDLPGLRVVHARWNDFDIAALRVVLDGNCLADDGVVTAACTPGSWASTAVRTLLGLADARSRAAEDDEPSAGATPVIVAEHAAATAPGSRTRRHALAVRDGVPRSVAVGYRWSGERELDARHLVRDDAQPVTPTSNADGRS
ncbi:MAG: hypothetical protein R2713_17085 [Ilumatobacteraceae bacterium]|nr:hypothetical protein [Acidimicrobiales bacterium]MCB9392275.1 hypothetical protein [Acidimicrobiaceae bacterium]